MDGICTQTCTGSTPQREPRFGFDDYQSLGHLTLASNTKIQSHGYLAQFYDHRYVPSLFLHSGCPAPVAYKTSPSDPDTLTFEQALADTEHHHEWMEAAQKEIQSLEKLGSWEEVDISEAKSKVIPGTWVFRCKRTPDGEIKKRKARFCCRGDLQEGEFETFAPVVSWTSVRLFLVLSMTLGWVTCNVDFSNAFLQADLKDPVWIHLPRGFHST